MKRRISRIFCKVLMAVMCFGFINTAFAEAVIKDSGIEVAEDELVEAIKYWPEILRGSAIENSGARYELLNHFMVNKKIAEALKKITKESDPVFYWQREFAIRNLQNKLYTTHFKEALEVPDMMSLAEEKYRVNKEKYIIPAKRRASHILLKCIPGKCERKDKKPVAEEVLKKLLAGEKFETLVEKYSEDPGTKARQGSLARWMRMGEPRVDGHFVEGVFSIDKIGGYSKVIETRFGFHIIRLDKTQEESFRPKEKVISEIKKSLEDKFRNLSLADFTAKLNLSNDAFIDDNVISKLLEVYKNDETKKPEKKKRELIIEKITRP